MKPKIIHCCWFGGNPIPEKEKKCMESWRKYLNGYEIILWNEENFDISQNVFCRQAYDNKQYAFVSDFVRAFVLFHHGGTYFDTDVEVFPGICDVLEKYDNILGFESKKFVGTAVMSLEKEHFIAKQFLESYEEGFIGDDGSFRLETNVSILSELMDSRGLKHDGSEQYVSGVHILPRDVFFPKKSESGILTSERTVSIHHGTGSWLSERQRRRGNSKIWINVFRPLLQRCKWLLGVVCGRSFAKKIEMKIRNKLR